MMMKMPKQYPILVMVLALYFWPWQLFSGESPASWLLSVITMQIAFVITCNIFVRDNWVLPVIIIEAVCMLINIAYVLVPGFISSIHGYAIGSAVIMEILAITSSMGSINGRANSTGVQLAGNSLWRVRGGLFSLGGNKESIQWPKKF